MMRAPQNYLTSPLAYNYILGLTRLKFESNVGLVNASQASLISPMNCLGDFCLRLSLFRDEQL